MSILEIVLWVFGISVLIVAVIFANAFYRLYCYLFGDEEAEIGPLGKKWNRFWENCPLWVEFWMPFVIVGILCYLPGKISLRTYLLLCGVGLPLVCVCISRFGRGVSLFRALHRHK